MCGSSAQENTRVLQATCIGRECIKYVFILISYNPIFFEGYQCIIYEDNVAHSSVSRSKHAPCGGPCRGLAAASCRIGAARCSGRGLTSFPGVHHCCTAGYWRHGICAQCGITLYCSVARSAGMGCFTASDFAHWLHCFVK